METVMPGTTRLLPLVIGTFAVGTDAFVIAGVLPGIAGDLNISQTVAGQLVTLFAIAYAVGSPLLSAALSARLSRRGVLLLGLTVFVLAGAGGAACGDRGDDQGFRLLHLHRRHPGRRR